MDVGDYWDKKYLDKGKIWGEKHTEAVEFSARLFHRKEVKTVLEVACGYGRDLAYLAKEGFDCTGVDVSGEAIRMAREFLAGKNISLVNGDLSHPQLMWKKFDAVYICNLLHLLDMNERHRIMRATRKFLKPGGVVTGVVLSVNDPQEYGKGEKVEEHAYRAADGRVMYFFTKESAAEIFTLSDFSIIDIREITYHEVFQSGEEHHHLMWLVAAG